MMSLRSWAGWIDEKLIAPQAAPGERLLGYGSGLFGASFAAILAARADVALWVIVVLAVMGFDIFGGVVVNATRSGSRRFHGRQSRRWSGLIFVSGHIHPLVLALLLSEKMPWITAVIAYAGVVFATVLIVTVPGLFRQPVAFASAAALIAVMTTVLPSATFLAWVLPLLVVKLLLAHLLPHSAVFNTGAPGHNEVYEPCTGRGEATD